jgi:hypothetical protein
VLVLVIPHINLINVARVISAATVISWWKGLVRRLHNIESLNRKYFASALAISLGHQPCRFIYTFASAFKKPPLHYKSLESAMLNQGEIRK